MPTLSSATVTPPGSANTAARSSDAARTTDASAATGATAASGTSDGPGPAQPPLAPIHALIAGLDPQFVPYAHGLELQREAADRIEQGVDRGTLIVLEHEATYTAGNLALPSEFPRDGSPVVPVDRGGKVTWHGPGQLIVYPVVRLRERFGGVALVRLLESAVIDTAEEFGLAAFRVDGRAGVWVNCADGGVAKLAQVGIRVTNRIVSHGLSLNCSNTLEQFNGFVPCGITDAGVTSLTEQLGHRVTPRAAAPSLAVRIRAALETVAV